MLGLYNVNEPYKMQVFINYFVILVIMPFLLKTPKMSNV